MSELILSGQARFLKLDASNDPITGDLLLKPTNNSTTTFQVQKTDTTNVLTVDTTNARMGIGTDAPDSAFHIKANFPAGQVGNNYAGQIIIQNPADSVFSNAVITGYESDGDGNPDQQLWYLGSSSVNNSDIIFLNRRNSKLALGTNGTSRITILGSGNVGFNVIDPDTQVEILNAGNQLKLSFDGTDNAVFAVDTAGDLTITPSGTSTILKSEVEAGGSTTKVKITSIGGIAVKLTNTTGANTIKGQIVKADPATDDAVILTAADDNECLGVFLDAGVADDAEAWVVVAGIADVAMEDNTTATRGNWVQASETEIGYADATDLSPQASPQHFSEIGHCIESVAAGGGGTHILARCVLHFN